MSMLSSTEAGIETVSKARFETDQAALGGWSSASFHKLLSDDTNWSDAVV
jgi:hypothetical protein